MRLIFEPIAERIESGTYLLYDGACGTGGMLTAAEDTLRELAQKHGRQVATHLYGQEINAETYAIAKADLLLQGDGENADNLVGGPGHSTLLNDAFPSRQFDFMRSNPPYGKHWKNDLERMGGKGGIKDPRFVIEHAGDVEYSLITRSSDGQMLFLANLLSKMKPDTPLGSRIAEVHNGSSLFTGDTEQVPLIEPGGVEAFLRREVLPYAADAWHAPASLKTGHEISFTRYFYQPKPLRTLEEIRADIVALEEERRGLLDGIIHAGEETR